MPNWMIEIFSSQPFLNGFWIFLGIISGALIQYFLSGLERRRHAKNAFQVMKVEISYNISEANRFLEHLNWIRDRLGAQQIEESEILMDMSKFDYSAVNPLVSSGYFHILLGPEIFKKYVEFYYFFRIENGNFLTSYIRTEHRRGKSLDALSSIESRAKSLMDEFEKIRDARLHLGIFETKIVARESNRGGKA